MDSFDLENARLHAEQEAMSAIAPNYAKALKDYGALGVIAMFLVWWMASDVTGSIKQQGAQITQLQRSMDAHSAEQRFFLRAICLNVSQTESQRAGCVPPSER